jgi:hypothetical protein
MFNFLVHRQALFMMLLFLYGFRIGRIGLFESWPAASYAERSVSQTQQSTMSPDMPQNAVATSGASAAGKSNTDKSAGNSVTEPRQKTRERTDMLEAGQQSPAPSLLEAVATHAEAQSQTENILGLIVEAN